MYAHSSIGINEPLKLICWSNVCGFWQRKVLKERWLRLLEMFFCSKWRFCGGKNCPILHFIFFYLSTCCWSLLSCTSLLTEIEFERLLSGLNCLNREVSRFDFYSLLICAMSKVHALYVSSSLIPTDRIFFSVPSLLLFFTVFVVS